MAERISRKISEDTIRGGLAFPRLSEDLIRGGLAFPRLSGDLIRGEGRRLEARLFSASDDGTLREWDVDSGETLRTLQSDNPLVRAVAVLDGQRVVSAERAQIHVRARNAALAVLSSLSKVADRGLVEIPPEYLGDLLEVLPADNHLVRSALLIDDELLGDGKRRER